MHVCPVGVTIFVVTPFIVVGGIDAVSVGKPGRVVATACLPKAFGSLLSAGPGTGSGLSGKLNCACTALNDFV